MMASYTMRCALLATLAVLSLLTSPASADVAENYQYSHSWFTRTAMPIARSDFTASTVGAKIILIGGCIGNQTWVSGEYWSGYACTAITNSTIEYDPLTGAYKTLADAPRARYRHAAASVGTMVYVFGGVDLTDTMQATIDVFDASKNTWSSLASPMPNPVTDLTATAVGTDIYVIGGWDATTWVTSKVTSKFDTTTSTWTTKASMAQHRGDHGAQGIGPNIYVFGGFMSGADPIGLPSLEIYNHLTNTWTQGANMSTGRGDKGALILNSRFMVIGGETSEARPNNLFQAVALTDVEVYSPEYNNWTRVSDIMTSRFRFAATVLGDERAFIFGGQGALVGTFGEAGSYHPVLNIVEEFDEVKLVLTPSSAACAQPSALLVAVATAMAMLATRFH